MTGTIDSANVVDAVYLSGVPGIDDPAENFFEASKVHAESLRWDLPGLERLARSPALRTMAGRAGRRYASRATVPLAPPAPSTATVTDVLAARRSPARLGSGPVAAGVLSSVLERSYGLVARNGHARLRPTPSAGALYPLDLYVVNRTVDGLRPDGLYHYDPFRRVLADLGVVGPGRLDEALGVPDVTATASFTVVVSAMFWRSRFKYGQRGLRFVLLEAGHLAQNLALVAQAHDLRSRPLGGFQDDLLTALLPDHNGVDDAPVYAVPIGTAAPDGPDATTPRDPDPHPRDRYAPDVPEDV